MDKNSKFYVISYDLKNPGREYDNLFNTIKTLDGEWKHPLESVWLLYTTMDANKISDALRKDDIMDTNDLLFVCQLNAEDRQGWLDATVWQWIREKMKE